MEQTTKRTRRPKEEIVREKIEKLETLITSYKEKIAKAEKELEELKNPTSVIKMKDIKERINELDLPLDEVMKALDNLGKK